MMLGSSKDRIGVTHAHCWQSFILYTYQLIVGQAGPGGHIGVDGLVRQTFKSFIRSKQGSALFFRFEKRVNKSGTYRKIVSCCCALLARPNNSLLAPRNETCIFFSKLSP